MKQIVLIALGLLVASSASAADAMLKHKLERAGAGAELQLNARTAPKLVGARGIIMGTCRQFEGKPLMLYGRDGKSYQLSDGIYESNHGLQIHIRNGAIARIGFSSRRRK